MSIEPSRKPAPTIAFRDRLSCTVGEAVEASGLSRRTINRLIADQRLASTTVGKRRLVRMGSLVALIEGPAP